MIRAVTPGSFAPALVPWLLWPAVMHRGCAVPMSPPSQPDAQASVDRERLRQRHHARIGERRHQRLVGIISSPAPTRLGIEGTSGPAWHFLVYSRLVVSKEISHDDETHGLGGCSGDRYDMFRLAGTRRNQAQRRDANARSGQRWHR